MKNATRITVSSFGTLVGIAGIEHGIGEILQGNIAPASWMILSWPGEGPFRVLSGEPAMTIIPNLLVSGLLTVLVSLIFVAWVIRFIGSKHGGALLALLSMAMLLVGGGLFPPVFGIILAVVATRIQSSMGQKRKPPSGWRMTASRVWPWSLGIGLFTWLLMMPGLPLASCFGLAPDDMLIWLIIVGMIGFLLTSIFSGLAFDTIRQNDALRIADVQNQPASPAAFSSKG